MTPTQDAARDKLARLSGLTRRQVDAYYAWQDERARLMHTCSGLLEALRAIRDGLTGELQVSGDVREACLETARRAIERAETAAATDAAHTAAVTPRRAKP